jgi:hypothetical protein
MSFYHLPHPYNPHYAIPDYVMAEPPGRGTITTKWLPRGTISQMVPDYLAKPVSRELTGRTDATLGCDKGLGSLGCDTLGAAEVYQLDALGGVGGGDPIQAYGLRASEWIMRTINEVEPANRAIAMRALLDSVDKSLWDRVAAEAAKFKAKGLPPKAAMQKALAVCLANGMIAELVKTGEKVLQKRAAGPGQLQALGFCGPICAAKKVRDAAKYVGGKVAGGASTATSWVSKGVQKLGGLACSVANSSVAPLAAGAGAAAMGAPPQAGTTGLAFAQTLCGKNGDSAAAQQALNTPTPGAAGGMPGWVLPAAIGGGVLVLVLALK